VFTKRLVFSLLLFTSCVGVPSEAEYIARYCRDSGESAHGIENFGWHLGFAFFRLAAIAAGVYKRAIQGNASDGQNALKYGPAVGIVSQIGLDVAKQMGNVTLGKDTTPHRNYLPVDPKAVWYKLSSHRSAYTNEALREGASLLPISTRAVDLLVAVNTFMNEHVFPAEEEYLRQHHETQNPWTVIPVIERLKSLAKSQGLWNLFLPSESKLTNLEYARMAEVFVFFLRIFFVKVVTNYFVLRLWGRLRGRVKCSTALLPTLETWRFCICLELPNKSNSILNRC
jgi:hypothetical protein